MSPVRFEVATDEDDAALRAVLAATPMEGKVRVSFRRDPSYFAAGRVEGPDRQTLIAREEGRIVGIGSRSIRARYVNGRAMPIGYLSGLRLMPEHRNGTVLARGYRFLHELHANGGTRLYLTTIAEGNDVAQQILTSGRTWLPAYHAAGQYRTMVLPLGHLARRSLSRPDSLCIRTATASDIDPIVQLLREVGPERQFFPCYDAHDFAPDTGTFRDLELDHIWLAFDPQQKLLGLLAAWDQRRFRQSVVEGYRGVLRMCRLPYNLWARVRGLPTLPATGQVFPYLTAALPIVRNGEKAVLQALLLHLARSRVAQGSAQHLLLGLHDSDPLLPAIESWATHRYNTLLYYVCWPDGESLRRSLDSRPPYLELGCL